MLDRIAILANIAGNSETFHPRDLEPHGELARYFRRTRAA